MQTTCGGTDKVVDRLYLVANMATRPCATASAVGPAALNFLVYCRLYDENLPHHVVTIS